MNRKIRTLALSRETLHSLAPRDLQGIAGGYSLPSPVCVASRDTCDFCPTYSCGPRACL